jgi:hypothetical protein
LPAYLLPRECVHRVAAQKWVHMSQYCSCCFPVVNMYFLEFTIICLVATWSNASFSSQNIVMWCD